MDLFSLVLIGNTENFDPVTLSFYECVGNLLQAQKKTLLLSLTSCQCLFKDLSLFRPEDSQRIS